MDFTTIDRQEIDARDLLFTAAASCQDQLRASEKTHKKKIAGRSLVRWNAIIVEYNRANRSTKTRASYIALVVEEMKLVVADALVELAK